MDALEAYRILGLNPATSSPAQIKHAYRTLVMRYHPDRAQGTQNERIATEQTVHLNLAFECLERAGFPKLVPAPPRQPVSAQPQWRPQPDSIDPGFEGWRNHGFRHPRDVLREDIQQFGLVPAVTGLGRLCVAHQLVRRVLLRGTHLAGFSRRALQRGPHPARGARRREATPSVTRPAAARPAARPGPLAVRSIFGAFSGFGIQ